jgi:hypothetical protein
MVEVDPVAHAKIDTHEKVCAERYGNIWATLQDIKRDLNGARSDRAASEAVFHTRLNIVSSRMWLFVAGVGGTATVMLLAGAGVLIMHLLTKVR